MDVTVKHQSRIDDLEQGGWNKRFVASEPRMSEAVQMYKDAGFDVHLEPLPKEPECEIYSGGENESGDECRVCFEGLEEQYKIIFTKPGKNQGSNSEDELF